MTAKITKDEQDDEKRYAEIAKDAEEIYEKALKYYEHPYFDKNRVLPERNMRIYKKTGELIVPFYEVQKKQRVTLLFIDAKENMSFLAGERIPGSFYPIGKFKNDRPILLTGGLASGLSLHEATENPVVVSGGHESLNEVAKESFGNKIDVMHY